MNIFGIYGNPDGFPIIDVLSLDYRNEAKENHIEIARRFHSGAIRRYACIVFVFRDGESVAFTF